MLDPGRHREIDVRHHALVQQQQLGWDRLTSVPGRIGHGCEPIVAGGCEFAHPGHDWYLRSYLLHQGEALCEIGRRYEGEGVRQRGKIVSTLGRVENAVDATAKTQDLRRKQPKQRSLTGDHRPPVRHEP